MTAVERFAQRHDAGDTPPVRLLRGADPAGEARPPASSTASEVDLDACTGCKACVAACHSLNGLDDDEAWRSVGLLHGGSSHAPVQQTVTTACHHCLDPACMNGCPVERLREGSGHRHRQAPRRPVHRLPVLHAHLPVRGAASTTSKRGIVRKCDMCSDRLARGRGAGLRAGVPERGDRDPDRRQDAHAGGRAGRAPSCPARRRRRSPCRPPTTSRKRAFPRNLLPADFYQVRAGHPHPPLVFMLVLTQLSVGAFVVEFAAAPAVRRQLGVARAPYHAVVALAARAARRSAPACSTSAGRCTRSARSSACAPRG